MVISSCRCTTGLWGRWEFLRAVKFIRGKYPTVSVRVTSENSEYLPVKVDLRKRCVRAPWMLNDFMNGVVREVKFMIREHGGKNGVWKPEKKVVW